MSTRIQCDGCGKWRSESSPSHLGNGLTVRVAAAGYTVEAIACGEACVVPAVTKLGAQLMAQPLFRPVAERPEWTEKP